MNFINNVSTVNPTKALFEEDLLSVTQKWPNLASDVAAKFLRICSNSGVKRRYFIKDYEEILNYQGLQQRSELFEKYGVELLESAISKALKASGKTPGDIDTVIFTSCSVPSIPSVDAKVLLKMGFDPSVRRIPIFQHGCAGGVIGLGIGNRLASEGKAVLVTSLELCSLVFQPQNFDGTQLVAAAIFADGAAATVIQSEGTGLKFLEHQSFLLPNTRHLMGYSIFDDGFHLLLDKGLPQSLVEQAPKLVNGFLEKNGLQYEDIDYWLFHPGGIKILGFLEDAFKLKPEQCKWSREVLRDYGNMSSATIHFVLEAFQSEVKMASGQKMLMLGIGPGLTLELILFEQD